MKNGAGTGGIIYAKKNREKIKRWIKLNPDRTIADCARELGFTWPTVKRHVVAIKKGE